MVNGNPKRANVAILIKIYEANIDRTERKRGNNIIVVNFSAPFSIMDFKTHTHTLKIN